MNITLNDEESKKYLEMIDKGLLHAEIQRYIYFLDELATKVRPRCFRFRDNDYHYEEITWENALDRLKTHREIMQKKLDKIVNKYRKEEER